MLSGLMSLGAENALFKSIGKIFHPLFELFGLILAGIYAVIPNYAVAIFGLTVVIMLALTPVTIKSTKSMIAMQRLQPEMKKLQVKYKGAENRETLNQEMMKLYKENGTSPFGACLPSLLQMPFLIVLYSLIRGLSYIAAKVTAIYERRWTHNHLQGDCVRGPSLYPEFFQDVRQFGAEQRPNALVLRHGLVVRSVQPSRGQPGAADDPLFGAHRDGHFPAVLPDETDE